MEGMGPPSGWNLSTWNGMEWTGKEEWNGRNSGNGMTNGMEWNEMKWKGMEGMKEWKGTNSGLFRENRNGTGQQRKWNGMEWNGMEWNGMEWNGMEWNGRNMERALSGKRKPQVNHSPAVHLVSGNIPIQPWAQRRINGTISGTGCHPPKSVRRNPGARTAKPSRHRRTPTPAETPGARTPKLSCAAHESSKQKTPQVKRNNNNNNKIRPRPGNWPPPTQNVEPSRTPSRRRLSPVLCHSQLHENATASLPFFHRKPGG